MVLKPRKGTGIFGWAVCTGAIVSNTVLTVDVESMLVTGDTTYNVLLQAGDVVLVPARVEESR